MYRVGIKKNTVGAEIRIFKNVADPDPIKSCGSNGAISCIQLCNGAHPAAALE